MVGVDGQLAVVEGQVQRLGYSGEAGRIGTRIFTSIPFKPTLVGSPVFDKYEQIVGIVGEEDSTSEIVVIPTVYIRRILKFGGIEGYSK